MAGKPFSKELYDSDDNAKHLVVEYLRRNGIDDAHVNPDDYGIDVLGNWHGKLWGFEVEIKHNWKGQRFPFKTVHIAARKRKFVAENNYLIMLNHERTHLMIVKPADLMSAKLVRKDTKYSMNEEFLEINVTNVTVRDIWS